MSHEVVCGEQCLPPSPSIIIVYVARRRGGQGASPSPSWPSKGAAVQMARGSLSPALQGARLSTAGSQADELRRPFVVPGAWRKVPGGPVRERGRERGMWAPGAGHSPRGRDSGASSELDLEAETVEALAVRRLASTGTVTERTAAGTARGPTLRERREG